MAAIWWKMLILVWCLSHNNAEVMEKDDLIAEESTYDFTANPLETEARYIMPFPYALNGGKPFSLEKDPLTGEIDYEKAPPVKALNVSSDYEEKSSAVQAEALYNNERDASNGELNEIRLHEFLHLPVRYSSDRYDKSHVPVISSSYANTKVQSGINSYNIFNHRVDFVNKTPFYEPPRKIYASTKDPVTTHLTMSSTKTPASTSPQTTAEPTTTTNTTTTTTTTTMATTTTPKMTSTTADITTTREATTEDKPLFEDEYEAYEDYEVPHKEEQRVNNSTSTTMSSTTQEASTKPVTSMPIDVLAHEIVVQSHKMKPSLVNITPKRPLIFDNRPSTDDRYYPGHDGSASIGLPSISVEPAYNYNPQRWYQQPPQHPSNLNEIDSRPKLQDLQQNDRIDFKPNGPSKLVDDHVVANEAYSNFQDIVTSPPTGEPKIISLSPKLPEGLSRPAENLTPPKTKPLQQKPQLYFHYRHTPRPEYVRPPYQETLGYKRRPDPDLPNILPQFKPRISHGHRGPDTVGTLSAQRIRGHYRPPVLNGYLSPPPPPNFQRQPPPIVRVPQNDAAPQNSDLVVKRFRLPTLENRANAQKMRFEEDQSEQFSAEPPQIPPRPVTIFLKQRTGDHIPRVATLQMIQQHGAFEDGIARPTTDNKKEDDETEIRRKDQKTPDSSVYVVYPVNMAVNIGSNNDDEIDGSVVMGARGPHRPPSSPETLHEEKGEESPLLVPNHDSKTSQVQDSLDEKDASSNIIPYLHDYAPPTPIAMVYTPTSQPLPQDIDDDKKAFQNFVAPFVASESAEAPVATGWSAVPLNKEKSAVTLSMPEKVVPTEFDPENFRPVLESGFKPIYEFANDNNETISAYKPVIPRSFQEYEG